MSRDRSHVDHYFEFLLAHIQPVEIRPGEDKSLYYMVQTLYNIEWDGPLVGDECVVDWIDAHLRSVFDPTNTYFEANPRNDSALDWILAMAFEVAQQAADEDTFEHVFTVQLTTFLDNLQLLDATDDIWDSDLEVEIRNRVVGAMTHMSLSARGENGPIVLSPEIPLSVSANRLSWDRMVTLYVSEFNYGDNI